ncbi:energy transducer TonB [Serratia ficaria]|uniref:energy transducer TonB n=1 Tax=Serratia ficaria TaxID=61651 RepID=UPI00077C19B5|nr:energy transducer TonB [Serratia ficaria]
MYLLYRSRHLFSWLPALIVVGCLLFASRQAALKIQPHYDETAIELALVEPEPAPEPQPETPPQPEPPPEPELIPEQAVPAPEPIVEARPVPKPQPKPKPKPKPIKEKAKPVEQAKPAPVRPAPRALVSKPAAPPAPAAPKVNAQAIENGYLQALRRELEQRKRYPSGRQASLERPQGNVEVWLEVDRSGRVLSSGIANKAASMLLNRAAMSSLQSLGAVKPFPSEAFAGQTTKRFTATFNYQAP